MSWFFKSFPDLTTKTPYSSQQHILRAVKIFTFAPHNAHNVKWMLRSEPPPPPPWSPHSLTNTCNFAAPKVTAFQLGTDMHLPIIKMSMVSTQFTAQFSYNCITAFSCWYFWFSTTHYIFRGQSENHRHMAAMFWRYIQYWKKIPVVFTNVFPKSANCL